MKPSEETDIEPDRTIDLTANPRLTAALAEAVCNHKDIDPLDSEFSLYEYLDPDALEGLVTSGASDLHLQFAIADVDVCLWTSDSDTAHIAVKTRQ